MCPYYQAIEVHVSIEERRKLPADAAFRTRQVVWCAHERSPSRRHVALKVPNSHGLLPCRGDVDKCTVPRQWR